MPAVAGIDAVLELVSGQGTPSKSGGRTNKNGTGQVGCPAPPEGPQHLILCPCCALPRARPSSHIEASTGLSEELPKNGDVPKSPLSAIGSLNAVGRHENLLKNRSWFVSRVAPAFAFCTSACWQRAFRAFHAVKGEHDESTYPAGNDDHSATVLGS
jgi:hypothetical protein